MMDEKCGLKGGVVGRHKERVVVLLFCVVASCRRRRSTIGSDDQNPALIGIFTTTRKQDGNKSMSRKLEVLRVISSLENSYPKKPLSSQKI